MKLTPDQSKFVEENYKLVYKGISKWLGRCTFNYEEIYDICVWSIIRTSIKYDPGKGAPSTLFFRIVENKMRNVFRDSQATKRKHNGHVSIDKPVSSHEGKALSLVEIIGRDDKYLFENMDFLHNSGLSQNEVQSCYLHFYKDLGQKEISNIMGVTQPHVSRLIRQGVKKLYKAMEAVK